MRRSRSIPSTRKREMAPPAEGARSTAIRAVTSERIVIALSTRTQSAVHPGAVLATPRRYRRLWGGFDVANKLIYRRQLSRRHVIGAAASLGIVGTAGGALGQQTGPWSEAPKGRVDRLNFVVWTYGDIYTRIAKQFEADWGVPVDSTISSFNDHPTKLTTMYAAGEKIDVSQSSPFSFPNFVNQGLVEPLDGLPGAADYIKDFTPFTKQVATVNGKTMGLPYFAAVWVWNYYADMLEKLKIDKPFATYDEL